ncbi:transposase [Conexivisphaera calida]|uniref:Transposase ISC1058 n=1 Tax=Conexivisphaera calida TaxID=1874277 RepID=A0A4P2VFQ5_9ARCH|nr:transposase [Conexivisphaera calida]BBE42767.1 Transposase ISC1058 [Conexivisphaera calida]
MVPEIVLPSAEEIEVAADATGLKAGSASEYRYQMYGGTRRKFVKVTIVVDVRSRRLLSVEASVQGEGPSEPEVAASEVRRLQEEGKRMTKLYGDGAYDSDVVFEALSEVGAEAAIRIRGNARPDSPGRRGEEVRLRQALGYREWAELTSYGMRWIVEAFFSAVKRKFGERLRARSVVGLLAEAMQRFWAYGLMRSYALARTGVPM